MVSETLNIWGPMPKPSIHNDDGRFMRIANGDVMTALTRASMMLCTAMVGLLLWYAQGIIDHMKETDTKLEQVLIHQATTDGGMIMLQNNENEASRRISRLEELFIIRRDTNVNGR